MTVGPQPWLLAAPCLLFFYYLISWLRIGPNPKPGTIVTRYDPPEGLSAAAIRYVVTTGSDGRSFAAVIAALATSGCLRVEPQNGKYKLSRLMSDRATEAKLAPEEIKLASRDHLSTPSVSLRPVGRWSRKWNTSKAVGPPRRCAGAAGNSALA